MAPLHTQSRLLALPLELREQIYTHIYHPSVNRTTDILDYTTYAFQLSFLRTNWQIYHEARAVFRKLNTFIRIETPWHEAQQYVEIEGHVSLVVSGEKAKQFTEHSLSAVIDAPRYQRRHDGTFASVIHVDDLDKFCKTWYYSDLSQNACLNQVLRLTFELRNPATNSTLDEDGQILTKALQRRLLEPFGRIKGLSGCRFRSPRYSDLAEELHRMQAIPYPTQEECIENGNKLKDDGNAALLKGNPREALRLYYKAFEAIHIVTTGRNRYVWADAFFEHELISGPNEGQYGQIVRLILRVRLVANIVQAYLKLQEWEEAKFWGMRTIRLTREAYGIDPDTEDQAEPLITFGAGNEMGKIYYRTALAYKNLDDKSTAYRLIKVAARYLPGDVIVQRDLASLAPRIL